MSKTRDLYTICIYTEIRDSFSMYNGVYILSAEN